MRQRGLVATVVLVLIGSIAPSHAATLVFTRADSLFTPGFINQGWWSATLNNDDINQNHFTGLSFDGHLLRSFYTFDLAALAGTAVTATLEILWYDYLSADPFETLGLF